MVMVMVMQVTDMMEQINMTGLVMMLIQVTDKMAIVMMTERMIKVLVMIVIPVMMLVMTVSVGEMK